MDDEIRDMLRQASPAPNAVPRPSPADARVLVAEAGARRRRKITMIGTATFAGLVVVIVGTMASSRPSRTRVTSTPGIATTTTTPPAVVTSPPTTAAAVTTPTSIPKTTSASTTQ